MKTAQEFISDHAAWLADRSLPKPAGKDYDLFGANLSEANLFGANLSEANLFEANLSEANLSEANLSRATLSEANLFGATLFGANLSEANLFGANLSEANLFGANLFGAEGIQTFGPAQTSGRMVYAVKHESGWMVQAGCFWGTLDELQKKVEESHKSKWYYSVIQFLKNYEV